MCPYTVSKPCVLWRNVTVEPVNNIGTDHYGEVVLFWSQNVLPLYVLVNCASVIVPHTDVSFISECPCWMCQMHIIPRGVHVSFSPPSSSPAPPLFPSHLPRVWYATSVQSWRGECKSMPARAANRPLHNNHC